LCRWFVHFTECRVPTRCFLAIGKAGFFGWCLLQLLCLPLRLDLRALLKEKLHNTKFSHRKYLLCPGCRSGGCEVMLAVFVLKREVNVQFSERDWLLCCLWPRNDALVYVMKQLRPVVRGSAPLGCRPANNLVPWA